MIKKIKALINENRTSQKEIKLQLKELEWAHVYHDSIRGLKFIEHLPLNIGRWAGNYTFFYILNRILLDYKPKSILELGLGESTKFISSYLENYLLDSKHLIIEHNENWKQSFESSFSISENSEITVCPLTQTEVHGFPVNHYTNLNDEVSDLYDLYVVDGPFGSKRFSRYDIVTLVMKIKQGDEFIILFDDCQREGEQDTLIDLFNALNDNEIPFVEAKYHGIKTVAVIATMKYEFITSL